MKDRKMEMLPGAIPLGYLPEKQGTSRYKSQSLDAGDISICPFTDEL